MNIFAQVSVTTASSVDANYTNHGEASGLATHLPDQEVEEQQHLKDPQVQAQYYCKPYLLCGSSVKSGWFMSEEAAEQLRTIIPQAHSLSRYPLINSNDISNHPTVPDGYEDALNQDHMMVLTQGSKVFYQLYVRSLGKCPNGIILRRSDIDDSPPEGDIATRLMELSKLFVNDELNVTKTPKAEEILQALANQFSRVISYKNRVIAENLKRSSLF
ncbi:hypothetical protein BG004_000757 [Podila humilis]|nr:hypothetical protein BG004_000757 [Podila humilis]